MYVWVMVSEGLYTPRWDKYLPDGIRKIRFFGTSAMRDSLLLYAAGRGIALETGDSKTPDMVLAFWNGTPDFVDTTIATMQTEKVFFLPNECGEGYSAL